MNEQLTDKNFILYAAKFYQNSGCVDTEEFYDDLKRFNYIKKLFSKFIETGELRERLILNHITILYNVFDKGATKMLFLKLKNQHHLLKPFLVLLNRMPEEVVGVGEKEVIYSCDIPMDQSIVEILRKI